MWKGLVAGAFALAAMNVTAAGGEGAGNGTAKGRPTRHTASAGVVITSGRIARIKAALKLTPEQERHWPPVEAALRELMRHQSREAASADAVAATDRRPAGSVDTARLRAVGAAAMPL